MLRNITDITSSGLATAKAVVCYHKCQWWCGHRARWIGLYVPRAENV